MNDEIWVVFEGENFEGGQNLGFFSTKKDAVLCAKDYMKRNEKYHHWKKIGAGEWKSGCDYLSVYPEKVYKNFDDYEASFEALVSEEIIDVES